MLNCIKMPLVNKISFDILHFQLADVLQPEENFKFLIRTERGPSSMEFTKVIVSGTDPGNFKGGGA